MLISQNLQIKINKNILKLFVMILLVVLFFSCTSSRTEVDVSKIELKPLIFKRLDKDVFSLNSLNVNEKTKEYQEKYGMFYNRYVTSILNNADVNDSLYSKGILSFINDKDMNSAYGDLNKIYSDNTIELMAEEMTDVVKRFKVIFPSRKTPKQLVTFMSGFNYNVVYVDSTLAVGLDMYLGSDNVFYSMLQLPKFMTHGMNKQSVVSDMVRGWLITEFDNQDAVNNLLNHMVFYGKVFYTCDALLPQTHDSIKFNYSKTQLEYCNKYENKLWGFFAKDNKLFDNDMKLVSEYTGDGPFTRSISKECPPRIIMWLGRNLVKSYMENNQDVSFEELMNEKDAQKILSKSKYKP
jgi:hypothetical protein